MVDRLYNGVFRVDRPCPANVRRIDMGAMPMVEEMNRTGILVDPDHFRRLGASFTVQLRELEDRVHQLTGHRINPQSPDQVAELLFRHLGLVAPFGGRMTPSRSRLAVDDDVLSAMLAAHPVVKVISDSRSLAKLKGTYCDALPLHVGEDGRIRTTLKMATARTGRLASEDPNLQNIPVKTEEGRRIREGFIAGPGRLLASVDLSQIEMVWAAELSQDPVMAEIYGQGQDLHVRTACALFRLDYERIAPLWSAYKRGILEPSDPRYQQMREFEVTKRLPAKTLGFAILYGVTAAGLQVQILAAGGPLFTVEECAEYIERWFELFGGVREWMEAQYQRVLRYGMVWTAFGRWRVIPEVRSALRGQVNKGLRQAGNTPVQGSAGDHLKLAMAEVYRELVLGIYRRFPGTVCDCLLQVHDELIFELGRNIAEDFAGAVRGVMCRAVRPMAVRVGASVALAENWGVLK